MSDHATNIGAFRNVPRTGVIYVTAEAIKHGYHPEDPTWSNLGQGQPETSALPGAPERIHDIHIDIDDHEYAPVSGLWELREAVAALYNAQYRHGLPSKYTAENVAICGGGRLALTRAVAALGRINLGHFLPDYTAYEELLDAFGRFTAIPILLDGETGYHFSPEALRHEIMGRGLGALLLSNPSNPTGRVIQGEALNEWIDIARRHDCTLLLDEFYSNYIWTGGAYRETRSVSAASFVQDVNKDPVVLFNGLTKNWRYPGWRLSWVVGPKSVIQAVSSTGSFLDGGGSRPLQRAALPLVTPEHVQAETKAIHDAFLIKRNYMISELEALGIEIEAPPQGTFYVWGHINALPEGLNEGMGFFRQALKKHVICVPGEFFDVNPGKRRAHNALRYRNYVRFSFGPTFASVQNGMSRLKEMIYGS